MKKPRGGYAYDCSLAYGARLRMQRRGRGLDYQRRAIEADWLFDEEIAAEFGVEMATVAEVRRQLGDVNRPRGRRHFLQKRSVG